MDFLTQASTEVVLIIASVLATVGAVIYARHSNKPRLSANGLSGMRQQAMTTAQGVAMTQAVAGRSVAQPQRRQAVDPTAAQTPQRVGTVRRR
jgi:hypothetical protein